MAEHAELAKEMVEMEKLPSQDRLKLARKRRQSQLKKYNDMEKKHDKQEKQANKRKSKAQSVLNSSSAMHQSSKTHSFLPQLPQTTREIRVKFEKGIMLLEAAARNDVKEVRALLEEGVNPDVANEDGLTALHQCCIDDSEDMLLLLLEHGANVNSRDSEMWTPLHAASTCAHLSICRHLLAKSADLLAVNADGNMPYDICDDEATLEYIETEMASQGITQELIDETRLSTEKNMLEEIKEYEREGNQVSSWRDRTGATLLHIAAANGYFDVTSYLLTKRLNVNATDVDSWTPAMAAACWGQVIVLELLAKHGADLEVKTKDNKSLVDLVDDQEVKEQITEIKQEIKVNLERFRRANSDVKRRSSTNIKSSSVRRHSMREKHRLSIREARDEAKYRITIHTTDGDNSTPSSPDDPPADKNTQESSAAVPVTNIDDLEVTVSDNNVTTIHISQPPPEAEVDDGQQDSPPPEISQVEKSKLIATISIEEDDANPAPKTEPPPKDEPKAIETQPLMNGGDRNTNGNTASMKMGILKHSTESASPDAVSSGDSTEKSSKFKQNAGASSDKNPIMQAHGPPNRRDTSYARPVEGPQNKVNKSCCIIS